MWNMALFCFPNVVSALPARHPLFPLVVSNPVISGLALLFSADCTVVINSQADRRAAWISWVIAPKTWCRKIIKTRQSRCATLSGPDMNIVFLPLTAIFQTSCFEISRSLWKYNKAYVTNLVIISLLLLCPYVCVLSSLLVIRSLLYSLSEFLATFARKL